MARSVSDHAEEQRALATIGRTYLFRYESDQLRSSLEKAEDAFRKSLAIVDDRLGGLYCLSAGLCVSLGIFKEHDDVVFDDLFFLTFFLTQGTVPAREISEMKARLFLNLGLVCDHLGEPKRCSEFIRRSVFIAEYENPKLYFILNLKTQRGR